MPCLCLTLWSRRLEFCLPLWKPALRNPMNTPADGSVEYCPRVAFRSSNPRQTDHVRRITQVVPVPRQGSVHKERVGGFEGAIPGMNVPEYMKHGLYPAYCVEKLSAPGGIPGTGTVVEDAKGRAMGDQEICIGRNT